MVDLVGSDPEIATVRTQRQSTCNACQLKSTCGQSLIANIMSGQGIQMDVPNSVNAKKGDVVLLSIPEQGLLRASMIMFLLPLIVMLVLSAGAKLALDWPEPVVALIGLAGLAAGFMLARMLATGLENDPLYQPRMSGFVLRSDGNMDCHKGAGIPLKDVPG